MPDNPPHTPQTQKQAILAALQDGRSLTPIEALAEFGCFRLGARIHELREEGYAIATDIIQTYGGARIARYRLLPSHDSPS